MIRIMLVILLFSQLAGNEASCPGAEGDPTSKVLSGIADLISNRDEVHKRYAYVAVGEYWYQPPQKAPELHPFCHMKVRDAKSGWCFGAYGKPFAQRFPLSRQSESWQQLLQCDGKFKINSGTIRAGKSYQEKPTGMRLSECKAKRAYYPIYFDPFDDILMIASFLNHQEPTPHAAEKVFLDGAEDPF